MAVEVLQRKKICQFEGVYPVSYGRWDEGLVTFKEEAVRLFEITTHLITTQYGDPRGHH
jgi:hypothetical protein